MQTVINKEKYQSKFRNYKTKKFKIYLRIKPNYKIIITNLKLKYRNLKMDKAKII